MQFDRIMGIRLERDSNGRMILSKEKRRDGRIITRKILTVGLAVALVTVALTGIQAAIAAGDKNQYNNQLTMGEDTYYEENNNNTFDDYDFPGLDTQNRTGVDEDVLEVLI